MNTRQALLVLCALLAGLALGGAAYAAGPGGSIYTCTDASGRTLTSDRPIPACSDREQRELDRSGVTKRVIPPGMTALEREAWERRRREEQAQKRRARELARRDRALLIRYPNQSTHELARTKALEQSGAIIASATRHLDEVHAERERLNTELEFYDDDPSQVPRQLRTAIERNWKAEELTLQLISDQQIERNRINARFDDEATFLTPFWAAASSEARENDAPADDTVDENESAAK